MKKYLVVATEKELDLPEAITALHEHRHIIVTGVGAVNAIKAMRSIPRDADILNVGYVGSRGLAIGTRVEIGYVSVYHPHTDYSSPGDFLGGVTPCFSSLDFVSDESSLDEKTVVDMELAFISALGFKNLKSIKYVSDNFNYKQYESCLKK